VGLIEGRVKAILNDYGNKARKDIKELLKSSNVVASAKLVKSVDYSIKESLNGIILEIEYIKYGEFVKKGRKRGRKMPPVKSIKQWMNDKGIRPRDKRGRFQKKNVAAYLIAKKIKEKGIKPFDFTYPLYEDMQKLISQITKELKSKLEKDIKKDILKVNEVSK